MSIGSTIKRLRREKDLTQEQLAEYLGITSRAISQWECDRTAPDISQIPALCHVLDVSSDTLLGIDITKSNEEIENYLDQAFEEEKEGNFKGSEEILRDGLRKFPKSYKITYKLAESIVNSRSRAGLNEYDEVFELCNRILTECTDSITRQQTTHLLGTAYNYAGKQEEMRKLAEELPHVWFSYEDFMRYHWKGDDDFSQLQDYMSYLINRIGEMIELAVCHRHDDGTLIYPLEDRIKLWKTHIALIDHLFPDGDYLYAAQYCESSCGHLFDVYNAKGDYEEAWRWLERGAEFAIHFDTYDFEGAHSSPILRGYISGGWIIEESGYHSKNMLNYLKYSDEVAAYRSDTRYEALVSRLESVCPKH